MSDDRTARWNGSPISSIVDRRIEELGLRGFKEFAKRARIPYTTLYNIARGKRTKDGGYSFYRPSMDTLPALAQALNLREDEVTYLFTVVSDDRESRSPDSPLYEDIEAAMIEQYRLAEEGLGEYAQLVDICPETLEAVFYGGKDSEGDLAQPPVGTLQDIALATEQNWFYFMDLYADHPKSNHMFFSKSDVGEMKQFYLSIRPGMNKRKQPNIRAFKILSIGPSSKLLRVAELQEPAEEIWLDENYVSGRNLSVFRVLGDSMEGGKRPIFDGDLIIINCDDKGRDAVPVVARLKDGSYVCKLLRDERYGRSLISTNPTPTDGTPFHIPLEEAETIEGRVVEVRRSEDFDT